MIWFACKQCGKCHGRAESLSGTLVFCECGQGNRVPWSSTVPEPEPEVAQPAPPPSPPRRSVPQVEDQPEPEPSRPRRQRERRRANPAYCLNHDEKPTEATCDACHGSFCSACVITLQGQTLCGPCKNFRIRGLNRPSHPSPLAIVTFVLALVVTVVCLFLNFLAIGFQMSMEHGTVVAVVICLIGLVLACGEMLLGWLALRQIDRQPSLGGRALAMTGTAAGLVGVLWSVAIAVFSIAKQWQG